jgi:CPA1 family monovalent cation:H+ antiporter
VFALNILAFIFIGLQIRPILDATAAENRLQYFTVGAAVLGTVIIVRLAWHMLFNAVTRWRHRTAGFNPPRPLLRPTVGSGLIISWSGMRGIVTLAAALALPPEFPYRGLIVLTAATVVLGTLVIQGLTLKPLLRFLNLHDDDPVGREERAAHVCALAAAFATVRDDPSMAAETVRQKFKAHLTSDLGMTDAVNQQISAQSHLHGVALRAARQAILAMRTRNEIGDDAFHRIEEKLDWIEIASGDREH